MQVDLDHAGVGRHFDHAEPCVECRRRAFDDHRHIEGNSGLLDGRYQIEKVLGLAHRRQENVENAVARLDAQRTASDPASGFLVLGFSLPWPVFRRCFATGVKPRRSFF